MTTKRPLTSMAPPVPELPVTDVEVAQRHYRDALGFEVAWLYPDKKIGAVSRGEVAIFLRKRTPPFEPRVVPVKAGAFQPARSSLAFFSLLPAGVAGRGTADGWG